MTPEKMRDFIRQERPGKVVVMKFGRDENVVHFLKLMGHGFLRVGSKMIFCEDCGTNAASYLSWLSDAKERDQVTKGAKTLRGKDLIIIDDSRLTKVEI